MANRLKGKAAVVTGAGRGIGRGIALALAAEGAKVVVNDLGGAVDGSGAAKSPADEVVAEIKKRGGTAVANYDSVAVHESGEKIIKACVDHFGKIDILVNVAGILRDRMIFNMTEEEFDDVIRVHLKGTFNTTKFASLLMRQQRSGRIINFTSVSGLVGNSGQGNYGAAKGGIAGFTRVCAKDLGRYGVTVNCISPGASTRMTQTVPAAAATVRAAAGMATPAPPEERPFMDPEDVAPIVVWLCTDAAAHVNGQFFGSRGGTLDILAPGVFPIKTLHKQGRWTLDELEKLVPEVLLQGYVNPAPPVLPKA